MRASGIPAQYVSGTLSQSQAQTLILSMFPASYQTVGYIPAGTQIVRPGERPAAPRPRPNRTTGSSSTPAAA